MAAFVAEGTGVNGARCVSCISPTNIAVIKYWGKRDIVANLPINSSLSVTLSMDNLRTTTTVCASDRYDQDRLWLNGNEEDVAANKRVQAVLRAVRARAGDVERIPKDAWPRYKVHIVSENSFPTAAGLASSASGYACLVRALAALFGLRDQSPGALSAIARVGSGSASRSLMGGFVRWHMGDPALDNAGGAGGAGGGGGDGAGDVATARGLRSDSRAIQIADENHWPELEALILVVSDQKKATGSTSGMTTSVATSALLAHRAATVVPARLAAMEDAVRERDFASFARITMQDSNQFHATCLDTYPPIFYMNDTSRAIIGLVHDLNAAAEARDPDHGPLAAYTFDAGPNAVIYARRVDVPVVLAAVTAAFPAGDRPAYLRGRTTMLTQTRRADTEKAAALLASGGRVAARLLAEPEVGVLNYIMHTCVGKGAELLPREEAALLADPATGEPRAKKA